MQKIKLENVSFNKLKEFTSLGSKKNTTIKGKFTLIGEYQLITKDGGDSMTIKELNKKIDKLSAEFKSFVVKQEAINNELAKLLKIVIERLDKLETLVYRVIKINNLKS